MFRDIAIVLAACWFFLSGGKRDRAPHVAALSYTHRHADALAPSRRAA